MAATDSSVRWSTMRTSLAVVATVATTLLGAGCHAPDPVPPSTAWRIPPDLQTFGVPTQGSIRVAVIGFAVKRPGYYILPAGTTVHDAIQAAQGLGDIVGWRRPYSGIQRHTTGASVETIWFTRSGRTAEEQLPLQAGDVLRISHEVY
jgi:hypothetical protein